jgi:hypothetical protein
MKDTQLRGLLLQVFYKRRRESWLVPTVTEVGAPVTEQDILQVCSQLGQHGLIEWKSVGSLDNISAGMGKITAFGVDVIEGEATPDIKIEFVQNQTVNITSSNNVVVGNNNSQTITHTVRDLVSVIESSGASPAEKAEAKSLLRKFLEHPLLAAVAGGAVALLGS